MNTVLDLEVVTVGGVQDLCRVLDVLALLGLTPAMLAARQRGVGLEIQLRLDGDARSIQLCRSRLGVLVGVRSILVCPAKATRRRCAWLAKASPLDGAGAVAGQSGRDAKSNRLSLASDHDLDVGA